MGKALGLAKQGRLSEAEQLFEKLCEQNKQNGMAWFMRGAIRFEYGDMDRAREYMDAAIRLDPGNTEAHFTLCKLYLAQGDLAKAIAHVNTVVELDPQRGEAWLALGSLVADAGQFARAEQASRRAMTLLPGVSEAKMNLVNALISQEGQDKRDEAITLCKDIEADDPGNAGIWHSLGLALKALGLVQDADRCLTKATTLDPDNAAALCTLGEIKASQNEFAQALRLYEKARVLAPAFPKVHFEIGKLLLPNSSARHRHLVQKLEQDHQYREADEARNIARELATGFRYADAAVERALVRFFDEYDPAHLYPFEWWTDALKQFGDRRRAPDTALRSVYSAVFSWSLPCRQALDEVAAFAGTRLASYGSGAGYWEYLLTTYYGIDVMCHDMILRHRFMPMQKVRHADATVDPHVTIFLAWLPGDPAIDPAVESLLDQARAGQKLVLVGEPADEYGRPRTCGTQRFFHYLRENFDTQAQIPLANYAYFTDRVELLVRK